MSESKRPKDGAKLKTQASAGNRDTKKPKKKRRLWKVLLLLAVFAAAAFFGVLLLDELGIDLFMIGDFAQYTYARSDGAAVTEQELAAIQAAVEVREAGAYPGSRGYGVPRLSLRGGVVQAKVRSNLTGERKMLYLLSGGELRLLDADMGIMVDRKEILSASEVWTGNRADYCLRLQLNDAAAQRLRADYADYAGESLAEFDGEIIFRFKYESSALEGSVLSLPYGIAGDIRTLAAAINHPLDVALKDVTVRPTPTPRPTVTPSPTPKPTPTVAVPELLKGESYYRGTAKLSYCDGVTVGFVLSADHSEIRSVTFTLTNLSVSATIGNTRTTTTVGSSISTLSGVFPVEDGRVEISAGPGTKLTLSGIGTKEAAGTLQYTYNSYGTAKQSYDLGAAPITTDRLTVKE